MLSLHSTLHWEDPVGQTTKDGSERPMNATGSVWNVTKTKLQRASISVSKSNLLFAIVTVLCGENFIALVLVLSHNYHLPLFNTSIFSAVNNVIGELPLELSVVFGLQEIDLFYNAINGTLSSFEGLENLASLNLQENLLTGSAFPSSITTLPRLSSYLVSDNLLSGKMNSDIGYLTTLKELWAGNNEISGTIPSEIGDLRNLKTIYLNNNKLAGELPTELGFILLDGLVLNDNKFVGTIPNTIFNVASLDTLRLDGNFLSGTLPFFLGQLTDLTTFRVERNNLDGQIPESIGYMTNLGKIDSPYMST